MLEGALIMWFVLTILSLIYLCYALWYHTPGAGVMKLAWFLVVLYTGPLGLFLYLLSCREPFPGTHEQYINFRWKQSLGSEIHCLAGDATGIIIAALILSFFTISAGVEMAIEYIAGFVSGLFIFQALFMKDMMGGDYWRAVKGTFMSEWLSMNLIMAGMLPVMFIWRYYDPNAADPSTLSFWGSMSLATIIGGILAFPMNDWLVTNGLKHGMVTVRKPGDPVAKMVITEGGLPSKLPEYQTQISKEKASTIQHERHHAPQVATSKLVMMTILSFLILAIGVTLALLWSV